MTWEKINGLRALKTLIKENEQRLEELEARLAPGGRVIDGMPRNVGNYKNMTAELVPRLIELKGMIHHQNMVYIDLEIEIEKFISEVPDYTDRLILELRFVRRYTWSQVARRVGGANTKDSVRNRAVRLIQKSEK